MQGRMNDRVVARLRTELACKRLSQSELARRMDVRPQWISRRMSGKVPLTLAEVEQMADVLDMPPEHLLVAS